MTKVLIVKTSALGDLVHIFPAIRAIKKFAPDAQIDWVVERSSAPIASAHPDIHQVIELDSRKWRKRPFFYRKEILSSIQQLRKTEYDVLFDFQANSKSALITLLAKAKQKIGFNQKVSEWPARFVTNKRMDPVDGQNIRQDYLDLVSLWSGKKEEVEIGTMLRLSSEEKNQLDALLKQKGTGTHLLIAPFSRWPNKQLLDSTMAQFLSKIQESKQDAKLWIISGNDLEREKATQFANHLKNAQIAPKLTIPQLQWFMKSMNQVISVDSLALHLAYEAQVPTFALFGSSSPTKYGLSNKQSHIFFGSCPYGKTFEKRCPILRICKTGACLHDPSAETIMKIYQTLQSTCPKHGLE